MKENEEEDEDEKNMATVLCGIKRETMLQFIRCVMRPELG